MEACQRPGPRRVLIISDGPVPTPEQAVVEGGGLRCWGLAMGLRAGAPELEVTVAYHASHRKPDHTDWTNGVRVTTWDQATIAGLVADADTVLVSYCLTALSSRIASLLTPDQQLVLDAYVPIHVEVSARGAADPRPEYRAFQTDLAAWNESLRRGDLLLCASESQRLYYLGVLGALGRLNPLTYGHPLVVTVPFGIPREAPVARSRPITRRLGESPARRVVWFGGLYPWFDLRRLVDAVALANERVPMRLTVVGARNPFQHHPDFLEKSRELVKHCARPGLRDLVHFEDWVAYHDRADWYLDADLAVLVNEPGDENALAWRTRLVDCVWAGLPVVTNGGDPLGERLIAAGAAHRFDRLEPAAMAQVLTDVLSDPTWASRCRERIDAVRPTLFWDLVTQPLAQAIREGGRAPDAEHGLRSITPAPRSVGAMRRAVRLVTKIASHGRDHGVWATAAKLRDHLAHHRPSEPASPRAAPRITVLSHQLDQSGAPFVLLDLLEHLCRAGLGEALQVESYPPTHPSNRARLRALGVPLRVLHPMDLPSPTRAGDVVLLNTVGFRAPVREALYEALERDELSLLVWYVHEDEPERLFTPSETRRVRRLVASGRMKLVVLARGAHERFQDHFGVEVVREPYRFELPRRYHKVRGPEDFETLRFVLSGSVADGRKGQLAVLYALATFHGKYDRAQPTRYRDYTLTFVGLEESFLAQQIERHRGIHGDRLRCIGKVGREESLRLIQEANVTICYSLRECLPLFVFEGMLAGHPVIRNECSGVDEQLEEGRNGFLARGDDFWHLVEVFETILNREKTSAEQLAAMSRRSHAMALAQGDRDYRAIISLIKTAFRDEDRRRAG